MIPFKLPSWHTKIRNEEEGKKNKIVSLAISNMEDVMKEAVNSILDHYIKTDLYSEPSLNSMYVANEEFYRNVITEAFYAAKKSKESIPSIKRLAKPPPDGLPKKVNELRDIFQTSSWFKIMKRSNKLTDRLRTSYLKKLRKNFEEIVPWLHEGKVTPQDVKKYMMEAWGTSKSRVETIFRTETTTYFGKTQIKVHAKDPDIIGFLFDSVRDKSRTPWCKSRHGLIYRPNTKLLKINTPACHWNCRSHLIPLANIEYNRKLLVDSRRNPENHVVVPLPVGWRKTS